MITAVLGDLGYRRSSGSDQLLLDDLVDIVIFRDLSLP